jgi:hypothetical protein
MGSFAERRVGSEQSAEVSDHEIVFRTRSHDFAVVITVGRPDKELAFIFEVGTVVRLFIVVGDAESNLRKDGLPESHVLSPGESVSAKSFLSTTNTLVEIGQAVLGYVVQHDGGGLAVRTDWYAAFSPYSASCAVDEVGGTVDVGVGEGGLEEEGIVFVEYGVNVREGNNRSVEFERFNNRARQINVMESGGVVVIRVENANRRDGGVAAVEQDEVVVSGERG